MTTLISRVWTAVYPPRPAKSSNAIRMGLFGASQIAPVAAINPARSHPDVIVTAVAARDPKRAAAYAKSYGIPKVHDSYDALLADQDIDAVYIPLPNGLHFEWTIKALKAGKHVLLEKPSTSNEEEARLLFDFHKSLGPGAPVLLEAFHYRFHPAFNLLKALVDHYVARGAPIAHVEAKAWVPQGFIGKDDIRFKYALAGGTMMDLGTYTVSLVRHLTGAEPVACTFARHTPLPGDRQKAEPKIDQATNARLELPGGATAEVEASLSGKLMQIVEWRARVLLASKDEDGKKVQRTLTIWQPLAPYVWHRIDVEEHWIDQNGNPSTVTKHLKAYTWEEARQHLSELGVELGPKPAKSEPWWSTYRHQLEEFVNRVKGREGSGVWIDGDNSVNQMRAIDLVYTKGGLGPRPTSDYRP